MCYVKMLDTSLDEQESSQGKSVKRLFHGQRGFFFCWEREHLVKSVEFGGQDRDRQNDGTLSINKNCRNTSQRLCCLFYYVFYASQKTLTKLG